LLVSFALFGQSINDCSGALVVCGNSGYQDIAVSGFGIQELNGSNTCDSEENQSIWFKLIIKTGGTLGFTLTPGSNDINEDFDFFVFGPNVDCSNIGMAIRCSTTNPLAAVQGNNLTGMNGTETDTSEGPGAAGNSFVQWLNVSAGDAYYLVIDRPIGSSNFSLEWTGTASFNEQPSFQHTTPNALDLEVCDTDDLADGLTTFDLTENKNLALGTQTGINTSYHIANSDAITGENPILNPEIFQNTSNPQQLFMRLTNESTACYKTASFWISTNDLPQINTFSMAAHCDDGSSDTDGVSSFDLSSLTNDILGAQSPTDFSVTFHQSQAEADDYIGYPTGIINTSAYQNSPNNPIGTIQTETLFVRILNNSTNCINTEAFDLVVNPLPVIKNPLVKVEQCDLNVF
ncbi:MAG: hypothetical protein QGH06_09045, partial [Lutibacter sp.]|nr:hypothetical protein [Lutibacter sp.]